jgi:hypothetical protein
VTDDPVALWQHIAERLPLGRTDCQRPAGTVLLLLAAGDDDIGWQVGDAHTGGRLLARAALSSGR